MDNIESISEYCLQKAGVSSEFPFGEEVLVFKVLNKIFLLINLNDNPPEVNLKADPETAVEWRERFSAVRPGYHMNKKHWNTVTLNGELSADQVREMIDHSYDRVVTGLTKKQREELKQIGYLRGS